MVRSQTSVVRSASGISPPALLQQMLTTEAHIRLARLAMKRQPEAWQGKRKRMVALYDGMKAARIALDECVQLDQRAADGVAQAARGQNARRQREAVGKKFATHDERKLLKIVNQRGCEVLAGLVAKGWT